MEASIVVIVGVALAFDFINGFHDAANSIATVVSTRVLSPGAAVVWAAFFNFIAFAFFGGHVAMTIGKGVVTPGIVDQWVILATLVGAISWNLITWYFGIPSSSSHALMGALAGAAVIRGGVGVLESGLIPIAASIVLSPLLGFVLAVAFGTALSWTFRRTAPSKVDRIFRRGQLLSAALYSLGHGGNDAQKTMGVITVLLFSTGHLGTDFHVPTWVMVACYAAIGAGTLAGGWRIVRTMGMGITRLQPSGGFCAETGGAVTLFLATALGIPVSTTHTITGSIVGVGALRRMSSVRWGVAGRIIWAWILTIPASAAIAIASWLLFHGAGWAKGA